VKERPDNAEKDACLTFDALNRILAHFFYGHNHEPYPKDNNETRYERWLRGMGGKLPEPLDERELDLCLRKEEHRKVEDRGVINFAGHQYQGEELRTFKGQEVGFRYDPDHALTLYVYTLEMDNQPSEFIGYAHAIDLDTQDLSLAELKKLRKGKGTRRSTGYEALVALDKTQQIAGQQKQDKKERKRAEQQKLRRKDKKNSNVVDIREQRKARVPVQAEPTELLPTRIANLEVVSPPALTAPAVQPIVESQDKAEAPPVQAEERHRLIISKKSKEVW